RYVTSIDAESGTVTVGGSEYLTVDGLVADRPYWLADDTIREIDCEVQVRAHGNVVPARLVRVDGADGEEFHLDLGEPLRGVAPGQAAVIYRPDAAHGDRVLGSATIRDTRSVAVSA
ncbi:MAG TPA: tRNA 2-thiouridine(34) synthase MnmA, partial [Dietzia timorensis]|nr:tRNA 2-thiouridine(34) synthase MnmA [Dietzia timorensis]